MNAKYYQQAEKLADQDYPVRIDQEYLSTGELVFVASNPDLPNCIGSGDTENEAISDLQNARIDYIAYLLQNNLDVPEPNHVNLSSYKITFFMYPFQNAANRVSEPSMTYYSKKSQNDQDGSGLIGRFIEADVEMGC